MLRRSASVSEIKTIGKRVGCDGVEGELDEVGGGEGNDGRVREM